MLRRHKKIPTVAAIIAILPLAHTAKAEDYICIFQKICYGGSSCESAKPLEITINKIDENRHVATLRNSSAFPVMRMKEKMPKFTSGTEAYITQLKNSTVHLITIFENGEARFSAHSYLSSSTSNASKGHCMAHSPAQQVK
jgi:hypothetical protein